jgi:hypothetical protein
MWHDRDMDAGTVSCKIEKRERERTSLGDGKISVKLMKVKWRILNNFCY